MFADHVIPFRALPMLAAALAFLFAPAAWAICTAGNPNSNLIETTPTADFGATATDGTVIHIKTSLMWKRCAEGQTWDGTTSSCTGSASALTWQAALAAAKDSTFAGHSDWRLPNVKELQSIVESCGYNPAINQTIFPATPATSNFWSASSYGPDPARAWSVPFNDGFYSVYDKLNDVLHVRLVRGGQSFNSFDLLLGAVTVSKTVAGAAAGSVPAGTNFPIMLTCGATTLGPLNATTATPAVFNSVPVGTCTVTEGTLPTIAGVTWGTPAFNPTQPVSVSAGATTPVTVTNTANVTTYAITKNVSPAGSGAINCDTDPVPHGGGSTCTAMHNVGYAFANWSGDCTGSGTCTLSNVTAAQSVTAHFTVVNKTFTGPTATGTGSATATVTGSGDTCGFAPTPQFVPVNSVPAAPPAGYSFPHGLFEFTLTHCDGTVTLTVTYPSALPAGTVYWKYGPTPGNASPHWYPMSATIAGNTATFNITDGGLGDDDLTVNGTIVDQGGPGVPGAGDAAAIPTLSEWALLLLIGLLGYSGWRLRRRGAF
ncbi:MAG: IPTL-CTERM sorting domain-containing protein [Candidatus Contendobacter sp.]|nr:IPTL-CTERM sorting domain-containing protein [Candidatus Contendobacter sp.]MDG4558399.1 IPTL-CTERM sorting domain-containing protein [Candidatus Contendobacter sp.]